MRVQQARTALYLAMHGQLLTAMLRSSEVTVGLVTNRHINFKVQRGGYVTRRFEITGSPETSKRAAHFSWSTQDKGAGGKTQMVSLGHGTHYPRPMGRDETVPVYVETMVRLILAEFIESYMTSADPRFFAETDNA